MQEFEENDWLSSLKNGSLEAYEMLFKKYYKLLCLQAALLLDDETEAEDLVQTLFIEMWDKKSYRQIDQSPKAYLYRSVRNKCINRINKKKLEKKKLEEYRYYRRKAEDPVWRGQRELSVDMHNVLQELPSQRLRAFTLVYMENKRYQEAANEMGVSVNSVKTHLKLALRVLREKLGISR
jgi:RNA polymerase sigma-70 factor (ECF subfamily)